MRYSTKYGQYEINKDQLRNLEFFTDKKDVEAVEMFAGCLKKEGIYPDQKTLSVYLNEISIYFGGIL